MFPANKENFTKQTKNVLNGQRIFSVFMGILSFIAGLFCFINPLTSSMALSLVISVFLLFNGIGIIITSIFFKKQANFLNMIAGFVLAAAYIFLAYEFFTNPSLGVITLSLFIGILFLVSGIIHFMVYINTKVLDSWPILILAVLEVLFSALVLFQWPDDSAILVAVILGFQLLSISFNYFFMASFLGKLIEQYSEKK